MSILDRPTINDILKSPQASGSPFTLIPSAITNLLSAAVVKVLTWINARLLCWPLGCQSLSLYSSSSALIWTETQSPLSKVFIKSPRTARVKRSTNLFSRTSHHYITCLTNFLPPDGDWAIYITKHVWTHLKDNVHVQLQPDRFFRNSAGSQHGP